ncbi:hypothetical protein JNB63_16990 [Microbacterium trichothecenolyticum]|nr:hypothetical protein [Microbacterium trichothecenolyticum]
MPREIITTPDAPSSPLYSQAVRAGRRIYLSGTVGIDTKTGALAGDTIQEHTRQVNAQRPSARTIFETRLLKWSDAPPPRLHRIGSGRPRPSRMRDRSDTCGCARPGSRNNARADTIAIWCHRLWERRRGGTGAGPGMARRHLPPARYDCRHLDGRLVPVLHGLAVRAGIRARGVLAGPRRHTRRYRRLARRTSRRWSRLRMGSPPARRHEQ